MEREVELECTCPNCGCKFTEIQAVEIEPPERDESRD